MSPDPVSVYAGGNDIRRPKVDIDAIVAPYGTALRRLQDAGTYVLLSTGFDLGWAPMFGRPRGRLTGRSSGDGLRPRVPELSPVGPRGPERSGTI